jgi:MinD superfamily P-loop ATPase
MHEILIISGKGGTGKTSLAAAFAHLSTGAVLCDLDVDAPDLHLILRPAPVEPVDFESGFEAVIDPLLCAACGTCAELCRFNAVRQVKGRFEIDPIRCEGCGVCVHFCPQKAIVFHPKTCGQWRLSETRFGPLVHARLYPGEENSGRLVALLRRQARLLAESKGAEMILSDGPPGIGCPVISALSGTHLAVIVTEPTPSGLHDLQRIVALCDHFGVPAAVLINKSDLNAAVARDIRSFCQEKKMPMLPDIPHDADVVHAMVQAMAITEYSDGALSQKCRAAWTQILDLIDPSGASNGAVHPSKQSHNLKHATH